MLFVGTEDLALAAASAIQLLVKTRDFPAVRSFQKLDGPAVMALTPVDFGVLFYELRARVS